MEVDQGLINKLASMIAENASEIQEVWAYPTMSDIDKLKVIRMACVLISDYILGIKDELKKVLDDA